MDHAARERPDGAVDGADLTLILANWGGCEA